MRRPRVVLQENKFLDLHNERKIMSMEGGNQDSNSYIPPAQSPNQTVSRSDNQTPQMKRNRSRKNDADADILRASNQQMTARLSYGPPTGALFLAREKEQPLGCVGLRALEPGICEMKRLYLRPEARGKGLGLALCRAVIERARTLGYNQMKLDTVSKLDKAIELYRSLGFVECTAYCHNPQPDVQYFELQL